MRKGIIIAVIVAVAISIGLLSIMANEIPNADNSEEQTTETLIESPSEPNVEPPTSQTITLREGLGMGTPP